VYRLQIALPRTVTAQTPIVYALDAEYAFPIVRAIVEHLTDREHVPGVVVVGVGYAHGLEGDDWQRRYRLQRTRDYTPTRSAKGYPDGIQDVSGGAPEFLDFVERVVIPTVEARVPARGQRIMVGHSYGGLFGAYALLAKPGLFTGAVLVSPSLWYDAHFLFGLEARTGPTGAAARVFVSAGALEGELASDVERYAASLARDFPTLEVEHVLFPAESHDTVFPAAVARGLWWVLAAH
jgi:uncharacterized protein